MDWSIDYYRGRGKGIFKLQHVQRSFARTWGKTMVVGGYIAHHQVHTIFQPLPRKVPPDHMCHKWPIGRACSGLRTLNWSLRFFCKTNLCGLCGLFFFAADYGTQDPKFSAEKKNRRKIGILCPQIGCKKIRTLVYFSFQRNSTTQIVYLTSADFFFPRRNLVFRPMPQRNSSSGFV